MVTQLVKGRANEDKRVAAEYTFIRIGRPFEFIEMESAGFTAESLHLGARRLLEGCEAGDRAGERRGG